jgi:hypothetical protein
MASAILRVTTSGMLSGTPSAALTTDPVAISDGNAIDAAIVLVSLTGTSFSVAFLGANAIDGNYVSIGPAALVLTRSPDVIVYRLGATPWAFVKLRLVASSASVVYSASVRQYSL